MLTARSKNLRRRGASAGLLIGFNGIGNAIHRILVINHPDGNIPLHQFTKVAVISSANEWPQDESIHAAVEQPTDALQAFRFVRVTELITTLIEARDETSLLRLRGQLAKQEVLVLADLGYIPASKAGAELLFEVVGQAYERQSLVVTTNLSFENWTEVLESERLTGAALDRLTHRSHILEFTGESYRLQDARRRRSKTQE